MHGGGHHGGGHHHWPGPVWWWYGGGLGGPGLYGYGSPFYDPFYEGWYGTGPNSEESRSGERSGDNVQLRVSPDHTSVFVNGVLYSSRGHGHFNLPIGDWKLELRAAGYLPQVLDLHVEQGIRYTVERKLERDRSALPSGRQRKVRDLSDD